MTDPLRTESPDVLRLRDPLSEVTRKERRALLGISVLGIALVHTGIVPSEVAALGITLNAPEQSKLLLLMALVCAYFLIAFVVYAFSDYAAWQRALHDATFERILKSQQELYSDVEEMHYTTAQNKLRDGFPQLVLFVELTANVAKSRAFVEFAIPVVVAIYSIVALLVTSAA